MNKVIRTFALTLILACGSTAIAQSAQAEKPAEKRARELARYLDSGNRAEFRKYVKENFAPSFLNIPMEQHLGFFSTLYDSTRGVEVHSFQDTTPTQTTALLKAKLTGEWTALVVRVEAEEPHRISGLGLRQPKPPESAQ